MERLQQGIRRRRVLHGVIAGTGFLTGCSGISESLAESVPNNGDAGGNGGGSSGSRDSVTHGGVSVTVVNHTIKEEFIQYDDDGNPCIASVGADTVQLSVLLQLDPGDTDADPFEIAADSVLRCDGDSYETVSTSSSPSDDVAGERLAVGFEVPEDVEPAACVLELTWEGTGSSTETFQFDLGPEQTPDIPDDVPSCVSVELRESFEVRVRNAAGEDRVVHGVDAIAQASEVENRNGSYQFTVTYTDEGAETIITRLREFGALENPDNMTFLIMLDGDVLTTLGFSADLAEMMERGEWLANPQLRMMFSERETAERVRNVIVGEGEA